MIPSVPKPWIVCHRRHLEARCRERGYSFSEVQGCICISEPETGLIAVDPTHPAYPRRKQGQPDNADKPPSTVKKVCGWWRYANAASTTARRGDAARAVAQSPRARGPLRTRPAWPRKTAPRASGRRGTPFHDRGHQEARSGPQALDVLGVARGRPDARAGRWRNAGRPFPAETFDETPAR